MKPRLGAAGKKKLQKPKDNLYFSSPKKHGSYISSGCSVLDCVLGGGWPLGRMVNIVGDKSTGKTLLAIEALANFQMSFPDGLAKYDETEAAFDDPYAEALGIDMSNVERTSSDTVEALFDSLTEFVKQCDGKCGLYIVDSLDAVSDKAEMSRSISEASYGASKPKQLGQLFRRLVKPLEKSKVCVIIISQVRDAIGVTFGNKHTRSGGRALDFYASIILWLAHLGQMKKTVRKVERSIGVKIKGKTSKNKVGLPFRECEFKILFGYGIDDVTSGLDFLKSAGVLAEELGLNSDRDILDFIKGFQSGSDELQAQVTKDIKESVVKTWYEIEKRFTPKKGKYKRTT